MKNNLRRIILTFNKVILGVFSILSLSSCEPTTEYQKVVENRSTKEITLIIADQVQTSSDSIIIKAGENYTVFNKKSMGFSDNTYSDCAKGNFKISFINPADLGVVDITYSPDWIYLHNEKNNGRYHYITCKYILNDS